MKSRISESVKYLNQSLKKGETDNFLILRYLNYYVHSSYCYSKRNIDGSYLKIQPGVTELEEVLSYRSYSDPCMRGKHKESRLLLHLSTFSELEISLLGFKRFIKKRKMIFSDKEIEGFINPPNLSIFYTRGFLEGFREAYNRIK